MYLFAILISHAYIHELQFKSDLIIIQFSIYFALFERKKLSDDIFRNQYTDL